jgi:hypothetical protein
MLLCNCFYIIHNTEGQFVLIEVNEHKPGRKIHAKRRVKALFNFMMMFHKIIITFQSVKGTQKYV